MVSIECPHCGHTRELVRKPRSEDTTCHKCAEVVLKLHRPVIKHFRICLDCGDTKRVKKNAAGAIRCRPCNDKFIRAETLRLNKPKKIYPKKPIVKKQELKKIIRPKSGNRLVPAIIAKARAKNKEHKQHLKEEAKRIKEIPDQKLSDEEMISLFLSSNKPSVTFKEAS